jgi:hypothetical protein
VKARASTPSRFYGEYLATFAKLECRRWLALMYAINAVGADLRGQALPPPERGPSWMLGGTLMIPPAGAEFFAVGLTAATARPLRLGTDLAFGIVPRALASGLFAAGVRANLAVPLPLGSNTLLIPSAGVSLLGAGSALGFAGARGYNGTIAMVGFGKPIADRSRAIGFRVAYSAHTFGDLASVPLLHVLEVGIVRWSR